MRGATLALPGRWRSRQQSEVSHQDCTDKGCTAQSLGLLMAASYHVWATHRREGIFHILWGQSIFNARKWEIAMKGKSHGAFSQMTLCAVKSMVLRMCLRKTLQSLLRWSENSHPRVLLVSAWVIKPVYYLLVVLFEWHVCIWSQLGIYQNLPPDVISVLLTGRPNAYFLTFLCDKCSCN